MNEKRKPIIVSNGIHEYFGKPSVRAALVDYLQRNGNDRETYDMLMILAKENQNKIIDIVCDYLDKNQLHKTTK